MRWVLSTERYWYLYKQTRPAQEADVFISSRAIQPAYLEFNGMKKYNWVSVGGPMLTTSVISNNVNNVRTTDSDIPYMFYVCYNNKTYPAPL